MNSTIIVTQRNGKAYTTNMTSEVTKSN
jgi:hypothetical protein